VYSLFRTILIAVSLAVASLTGATLLLHAHDNRPSGLLVQRGDSLDLRTLLGELPQSNEHLLETAFDKVEDTYYKPVAAQTMLDGERSELSITLKQNGVTHPKLPRLIANDNRSHDKRFVDQSLQTAEDLYAQKIPKKELRDAALRGMINALGDPYTTYLPPMEINRLEESLRGGDFGGIGVYIVQDPRTKQVLVSPIAGNPADKAGIKPGDEILSVDGTATHTMALEEIERMIRGRVGTVVVLLLHPHDAGKNRTVAVTRGHIQIPSAVAKMEDGFEYVHLGDFGETSYDEVRHAMLDGKTHHARGYILDLRDNGGGLLEAAIQISSLFVPKGTIVSTIDRDGGRDVREANHDSIGTAPLVVLVNKYTASASEITAGAIQDYKVGTLIGTRTFGKGVVQSIYNLGPDNGALKITTARYVTPLGRDIQHKGIQPDITIDQPITANIDSPKDLQLLAAKAYLRHIARR
jgi:carboxyl-terminal processing protease